VRGLPEIREGDDLAELVSSRIELEDGDVVVLAQKAVSKAEGRVVRLSEIEPSAAMEISAALARAVKGTPPFPAGARGVGFFPNARRPKVVWVGIDDPQKRIPGLHQAMDGELEALGHEKQAGPFIPHITVARVAEIPPGEGLARAVDPLVDTRFGWAHATGVEFIESTLKPGGPVYRVISKHPFASA